MGPLINEARRVLASAAEAHRAVEGDEEQGSDDGDLAASGEEAYDGDGEAVDDEDALR